jgi:hypothetical protein
VSLLAHLIESEIEIFISVLAGLIATKLLTGEINSSSLLYGSVSARRRGGRTSTSAQKGFNF